MNSSVKHLSQPAPHARTIGRYVMYDQIGSGGMATVHFGRLRGVAGFARTVAIKRLHPHLASNPQFASVFVSEARLAARIRHPNVVSLLDVIALESGELLLVMDYVHGETLAALLGSARLAGQPLRPALASAIMVGALQGLHAAHEALNEGGLPLGMVHGDVSPRNIIVDVEGSPRVLDFGVAKIGQGAPQGLSRLGTPGYMSPEKLQGDRFDRRADVFSAGAVLWEMLCLRRLFPRSDRWQDTQRAPVAPPSTFNPAVPPALDAVVRRALSTTREERFPTARAFATELERACPPLSTSEVSAWVASLRGSELDRRARALERIETVSVAEQVGAGMETAPSTPVAGAALPPPPEAPSDPTVIDHAIQDDRPTAIETSSVFWTPAQPAPAASPGRDEDDTVCESRPSGRVSLIPPVSPHTPEATPAIEPAALPARRLKLPRTLPQAARSALPALALLAVMYAAAAANGKRVALPNRVAAAEAPMEPKPPVSSPGPQSCGPSGPSEPAPAEGAEVPVTTTPATEPAPEAVPAPAPRPAQGSAAAIVSLNRRALAAYEQLETNRAMRLLSEGLRLCRLAGLERGDLAALTHLNMGIVLAGGFKQHGLAVRQFRRALSIRPGIEPSGRLSSPDITAAFSEAGADVRP
jgi:eukaryotic-like serine/threonine-protein kinase